MNIKPLPGIIYIKLEQPKAGALDTSSRASAVEYGEVLAFIEDAEMHKLGLKQRDKVFVKSWAIDSIYHNDERYNFINIASGGILAIVSDD